MNPEELTEKLSPPADRRLFIYSLWGVLALTVFSGVFLMVYYVPTFSQAFSSAERLNEQVPFGWMIRRLHAIGGNFVLLLILLHLLRAFCRGDYKGVSKRTWLFGVLALGAAILGNFTGFFLPLSQSAFWGTTAVLSNLSSLPWIGGLGVDLLRGGKERGGTALIRFYSMHIGWAAVMVLLFFWHDRRMATPEDRERGNEFPRLLAAGVVFAALLAILTLAPGWFIDPLKEIANPLANPERVSPPWYFLFLEETIKFFSGAYAYLTLIIFVLFPMLVLLLPWFDKSAEKNLLLRPVALALGSTCGVLLIYFSLVGTANARYGQRIVIPDRPLSAAEFQGAKVFAEKNCAYCHPIFGREGRREGPDMSAVTERRRSSDWIRRFTLNARLYQPGTTMPRYEIPLEDLEALSQYLLSLDPRMEKFKAVDKKQFAEYGMYLFLQKGNPGEGKK
ncbi:MAG: cytochrome b N-terminal domain-containing protein [Deltaproteobacteria bacterium]|nr:cytochrome b N-terminal domain-containing protein [Deltaproteobacteria bacterium]